MLKQFTFFLLLLCFFYIFFQFRFGFRFDDLFPLFTIIIYNVVIDSVEIWLSLEKEKKLLQMYPFCLFVVDDYDEWKNNNNMKHHEYLVNDFVCLFVLSVYCYFSSCLSVIHSVCHWFNRIKWMNEKDIFYGKLHWFDLNDVK